MPVDDGPWRLRVVISKWRPFTKLRVRANYSSTVKHRKKVQNQQSSIVVRLKHREQNRPSRLKKKPILLTRMNAPNRWMNAPIFHRNTARYGQRRYRVSWHSSIYWLLVFFAKTKRTVLIIVGEFWHTSRVEYAPFDCEPTGPLMSSWFHRRPRGKKRIRDLNRRLQTMLAPTTSKQCNWIQIKTDACAVQTS